MVFLFKEYAKGKGRFFGLLYIGVFGTLFLFSKFLFPSESSLPAAEAQGVGEEARADSIEIPKLGIVAPLIRVESTNPDDFREPLTKGVAWYPSANPGQNGSAIILGHSAPPGWPKINYDWVFSKITNLEQGDKIYIYFNNKKYEYEAKRSLFLKRGEEIPAWELTNEKPALLLVSCWPPGINNKRVIIRAEAPS